MTASALDYQHRRVAVRQELPDVMRRCDEGDCGLVRGAVSDAKPDEFGRCTERKAHMPKVSILGENRKPALPSVGPYLRIRGTSETYLLHVHRSRKQPYQISDKPAREIGVQ